VNPIDVFFDENHVGKLIVRDRSSTFIYSEGWMSNGFAIAPSMPIDRQESHAIGIHSIFSDAAPDRWGRKLIERKLARHRVSEGEYLLGVSDVLRMGALRFSLNEGKSFEGSDTRIPPMSVLPRFMYLTNAMMRGEDCDYSDLISNVSLGGARAKIVVCDENSQWLAKIPQIHDQDDVEGWEYLCLKLAKEAGMNVPECSLHGDKKHHTLLLKRFDRGNQGNRQGNRIHYMSAMTLMDLKDGDKSTYVDLAFEIADKIGAACLPELYQRMLFNICVSNVDDHLRNHGFLFQNEKWQLSPLFDVTISRQPYGSSHALSINGEDPDDFKTALSVCEYFSLDQYEAVIMLSDMIEKVSNWQKMAESFGLSGIHKMSDSIFIQEAKNAIVNPSPCK